MIISPQRQSTASPRHRAIPATFPSDLCNSPYGGSLRFVPAVRPRGFQPLDVVESIFAEHQHEIARAVGRNGTVVDLAVDDDCAAAPWLVESLQPRQYVAVRPTVQAVKHSVQALRLRYRQLEALAHEADFVQPFELPQQVHWGQRLFVCGAFVAELAPEAIRRFVAGLRRQCRDDGGVMIGVDRLRHRIETFKALLCCAGFGEITAWGDDEHGFTVLLARV